ncbi:protein of unknown function [Vibrio tapetis subsp. tapetis]|uniref:Uncharacterized protein n=1 Tax=Vibrio tapetis subsp. tapetis TaxID=1671868 RepID=A0A2N8ZHK7_9VIBR|nr:protein of unknown function [Vibrio tapetis subsp. tapetis]
MFYLCAYQNVESKNGDNFRSGDAVFDNGSTWQFASIVIDTKTSRA